MKKEIEYQMSKKKHQNYFRRMLNKANKKSLDETVDDLNKDDNMVTNSQKPPEYPMKPTVKQPKLAEFKMPDLTPKKPPKPKLKLPKLGMKTLFKQNIKLPSGSVSNMTLKDIHQVLVEIRDSLRNKNQ